MSDEDDYGRRRDADFTYANFGPNAAVTARPPTQIEAALSKAGMPQNEVEETATAIVKLMDRMKADPLDKQQQMVKTFMGRFGEPNAVESITQMALSQVNPKGAAPAIEQKQATRVTVAPPTLKR